MEQEYQQYLEDLIVEYLPKHFSKEQIRELAERPIKDKSGKTVSYGMPSTGPYGLRRQLGDIDYEFFARDVEPFNFDEVELPDIEAMVAPATRESILALMEGGIATNNDENDENGLDIDYCRRSGGGRGLPGRSPEPAGR